MELFSMRKNLLDSLDLAGRRLVTTSAGRWTAAVAVAVTLVAGLALHAQSVTPPTSTTTPVSSPAAAETGSALDPQTSGPPIDQTLTNAPAKKQKVDKADRVQQTKDTIRAEKKDKKQDMLVGKDAQLPDKQLYDKAVAQIASGHYDVGRLDLQTLLNTYPDSQYQMRAKLAVADAWYKEGGTAALTQAEQEYKDFITFFPNVPEAAEAQLRVGDIYFKQMDVPDRDYEKGTHAEAEYRTMLKQYPDAPKALTDDAKQKLREVQEVLATREAGLGQFYASHGNWAAAIARYQTVIDTYPLYSHMDDVMIGVGDAYEAQAIPVRNVQVCGPKAVPTAPCLPEGAKASMLTNYDSKAAAMYRAVVLNHSAAPHVEDAKERLAGMNLPIPTPTKEQIAASEALESSRAQYNLQRRLEIFFLHRPDTVTAAQIGDPPLDDATPTYAPDVLKAMQAEYIWPSSRRPVRRHMRLLQLLMRQLRRPPLRRQPRQRRPLRWRSPMYRALAKALAQARPAR
jgi:outer membrane protein assembly factor BamD